MPAQSDLARTYAAAVNAHDAVAFAALFDEQAVIDDVGREHRGRDAIRAWYEREVTGGGVALTVVARADAGDERILTTIVDGTFDRTGLPNPLIMNHRLRTAGGRITRLTCRIVGELAVAR